MRINSTVEALADKQTVKCIIRQDAKGPVSSETLTLCHTLLRRNEWQKKGTITKSSYLNHYAIEDRGRHGVVLENSSRMNRSGVLVFPLSPARCMTLKKSNTLSMLICKIRPGHLMLPCCFYIAVNLCCIVIFE